MADFYVTLPSNSQLDNKLNDFRVHLPYTLNLPGDWEVALVEIMYPHTWVNIEAGVTGALAVRTRFEEGEEFFEWNDVDVPTNYYSDPSELTGALNYAVHELVRKYGEEGVPENPLSFRYDPVLKRICCELSDKVMALWLSERLMYMMGLEVEKVSFLPGHHCLTNGGCVKGYNYHNYGFEKGERSLVTADYHPDMTAGTIGLYVYCNLVSNQIVGNAVAPLLRVVNIKGKNNDQVDQIYQDPHYLPILDREISSIHILIKDDTGANIKFQSGKVILKLHFRKRKLAR